MSAADRGSETQLPDLDMLDVQSLKALVLAKQAELDSRVTEIESLKLLIVKLKRMHFGPSSEKYDRDLQQLELRLEDLEANQAAAQPPPAVPATVTRKPMAPLKPARSPLPAELPRRDRDHRTGSGSVSRLWRHVAAAGRGRIGDTGTRSGAI